MDDPFATPRQDPYDIPDRTSAAAAAAGASAVGIPSAIGGGSAMLIDDPGALVRYTCGDCQATQRFARGETMRCTECAGRMFYKQRTKRMVQFEAR